MVDNADKLVIELTPDQLRALIQIVDNAEIRGRDAALVVSIQRALAQPALPAEWVNP